MVRPGRASIMGDLNLNTSARPKSIGNRFSSRPEVGICQSLTTLSARKMGIPVMIDTGPRSLADHRRSEASTEGAVPEGTCDTSGLLESLSGGVILLTHFTPILNTI